MVAALFASVLALGLASSANALLSLPYKKCDSPSGCVTKSTSIIMDGPRQDFSALQVYTYGSDGLLLTAPLSRSYLVAPNGSNYEMFYLKNRQISIDVDISKIQCGYNAAFYFASMSQRAAIGTGYCDAQGTNCNEMDIIEANYATNQGTMHACSYETGTCDPWGCGVNTWRSNMAVGPGLTIDTNQKFTLTTKFFTDTNTDAGTMNRIVQVYSQNGKSVTTSAITQAACSSGTYWGVSGGFPAFSRAFDLGQVMIFSFWGTGGESMSWLDGGAANPRCSAPSRNVNQVIFQNIVVSYIDGQTPSSTVTTVTTRATTTTTTTRATTTTTTTTRATTTTTTTRTSTSPSPTQGTGNCSAKWAQCGGIGWSGATCCVSGTTCTVLNPYYSQCL